MNANKDKIFVAIVTNLGYFIAPLIVSSTNIALPRIGREFSLDAVSLGLIATVFSLASTIFIIPFGKIADIYGRKRIYAWGMVAFSTISFLLSITTSASLLITLLFLHGVAASMLFATGVAMLTASFPSGERGKILGLNVTIVYLGFTLGPFVGGFLTQNFGWRSIFLSVLPIGLITIALILWKLKVEFVESKRERFDVIGSIIYGLALVGIIFGFSRLPDISGFIINFIGIVLFIIFLIWETKVANPVLEIRLFKKNKAFAFSCLATLTNFVAASAIGFLLSLYLQYVKGLSPQDTGLILVLQPMIQAIFSPIAGKVSDVVRPHIISSAGMACTTVGLLICVFFNEETSMMLIITALIMVGVGFAFFISPNVNMVMSSIEMKYYGVASGTVATARHLGMILNMGIIMILFSIFMGKTEVATADPVLFLQSSQIAFIISAVLCFVGIWVSWYAGKVDEGISIN